jgi:ParB/RepB/Spo0J family partition protein
VSGLFLVDIDLIDIDPDNPRGADLGDLTDLELTIAQDGLQNPVQLIQKPRGRWSLHEGHRRLEVHRRLGEKQIKAIKRTFRSELDRVISQGVLHAHAKDYAPTAWSRYLHRLCFEMPPGQNLKREQIAHRIGRSPNWVRDTMSFTYHLTEREQRDLDAGKISRAEALHRIANRRAIRDGRTAPAPRTTRAPAGSYFGTGHRLAKQVAHYCASQGIGHTGPRKIGGVGCGPCWEHVIGADARAAAAPPVLVAA